MCHFSQDLYGSYRLVVDWCVRSIRVYCDHKVKSEQESKILAIGLVVVALIYL